MYNTVKESFISFVLIFILSFILWYSNSFNDRIYAVFFFFCSFIQLIQYSIYSNGNTSQGAKIIFYISVFQILFVSIALFFTFRTTKYAMFLKIYAVLTLFYCSFYIFYISDQNINCYIENGRIVYTFNGKKDFASYFWIIPILLSTLILLFISVQLSYSIITVSTIIIFGAILGGITYYYQYNESIGSVFDSTNIIILIIFIMSSFN